MAQRQSSAAIRVEVLGPLGLAVGGTPVEVRGGKRRAALGLLALAEGRTVSVEALVDALWPDDVPDTGRAALHSVVSRLRGDLGAAAGRLETGPEGYRLALDPGELDLSEVRGLLARARALTTRDPATATDLLWQAHSLWRGPVLTDLAGVTPIAATAEACRHLRGEVTDALVAAAVAAGRAGEVCGLARSSLAEDPLREPAVLLLMQALAATGQAAEALQTGREFRARLGDEAGLDPTPALAVLERRIAGGVLGPGPPPGRLAPVAPLAPATRLLGREDQVTALDRLLATERLITLVGPGGVGKTRLALEMAASAGRNDQPGAATVLLLAPVTDPAGVPHALAAALGLSVAQGDVLTACLAVVGDRPGLLVVDNCEHLLDAARDLVGAVLAACPRLSVLATSRERLGLPAEQVHRLAPLPLPEPQQDPTRAPSVTLFLDRARRVRSRPADTPEELAAVADIVRRLDGMPLAIELAAGRLSSFSLLDLRARLDRALDLLGGGGSGDPRHRTLRATVQWSYELLTEDQQRLFRHLSAFVDGVDLATAERLAADLGLDGDPGSLLARLVDASVLDADLTAGTRYRMLETLRAFGRDRLAAAGELGDADDRLLRWAVDLMTWIGATLGTADEAAADRTLRRELANLRAAWRVARDRGRLEDAAAMVGAMFDAVSYRDLLELREWAEELADDPRLTASPRAALVLGISAEAAYHRGDRTTAARRARAGLELAADGPGAWVCRSVLSVVALAAGAFAEAVEHALASAAQGPPGRENLGVAALARAYAGDLDAARQLAARGIDGARSPSMRAWAAYVGAEIDALAGRDAAAEQQYLRAVDLARASGATFLAGVATVGLLTVRAAGGRVAEALAGYREVVDYFARTGNWTHQWATLRDLARLLRSLGDEAAAALLEAAADAAPDAPADGRRPAAPVPIDIRPPDRTAVLRLARQAIDEALTRS